MVKILMLTGDAGEAQEIYYAKFRLEEEGWQVQIATHGEAGFPLGRPRLRAGFRHVHREAGLSRASRPGTRRGRRRRIPRTGSAGRPSSRYLRNRPKAVSIVRHFLEARQADRGELPRPAAAPGGGRHERQDDDVLSRPRTRPAQARGEFVNQEVVVDGSLVTVRGWPDNGPWMKEFVRLIKGVNRVGQRRRSRLEQSESARDRSAQEVPTSIVGVMAQASGRPLASWSRARA